MHSERVNSFQHEDNLCYVDLGFVCDIQSNHGKNNEQIILLFSKGEQDIDLTDKQTDAWTHIHRTIRQKWRLSEAHDKIYEV
jgi:hypothetical protein